MVFYNFYHLSFIQQNSLKQNNFDSNFFLVWLLLSAIYWQKLSIMGDALIHCGREVKNGFLYHPPEFSRLFQLVVWKQMKSPKKIMTI